MQVLTGRRHFQGGVVPDVSGLVIINRVQFTTNATGQNATTTFADIPGGNQNYTPLSATSLILIEYEFQQARGADAGSILSHRIRGNGANNGSQQTTGSGGNHQRFSKVSSYLASWGISSGVISIQQREHSSSFEGKANATFYWNGGTSSQNTRIILTVTEYETV